MLRLVLEWGAAPEDLDAHLWLPAAEPYHVYWRQSGTSASFPFATLDIEDDNGVGPETITIHQRAPGRYLYVVYNYSHEASLGGSGARVAVYRGASQIGAYTVPTGAGRIWTVLEIDGATGAVTPMNQLSDTCPAAYGCDF